MLQSLTWQSHMLASNSSFGMIPSLLPFLSRQKWPYTLTSMWTTCPACLHPPPHPCLPLPHCCSHQHPPLHCFLVMNHLKRWTSMHGSGHLVQRSSTSLIGTSCTHRLTSMQIQLLGGILIERKCLSCIVRLATLCQSQICSLVPFFSSICSNCDLGSTVAVERIFSSG